MTFLRRPGPSSLPKGLFTRYPQGPDGGSKCLASTHRPELGNCMFFIFIDSSSTFETVILQESHLLHWWLLLVAKTVLWVTTKVLWKFEHQVFLHLSSCFFSFFYFVCPYLVVCLFLSTTKNKLHVAPWPTSWPTSWSCNKFVTFNGPPRKDRTNLEQQQRWKARGKIACRGSKCFPHFSVEVVDPFRENLHEKSTVTWRNFPKIHLNIQSPQLRCFCGEKSVFPGLHKGGERDGLPGISQNRLLNLLHLQLRF